MFGFRSTNRRRRPLGERVKSLGRGVGNLGRKALPVAFLLAVAIGLPYGIFHAYISTVTGSYFQLAQVEVHGLDHVERGPLLEKAGLLVGLNIFDVDLDRAKAAIEAEPWVASATLERRLPDRVIVHVTEHEPVAVVVDERYHLIDAHGRAFKVLDGHDLVGELMALPLITGLEAARLDEPTGKALFHQALDVAHMYAEMGLTKWEPLSEIHIDPVLGLTLVTADTGIEIRLGNGRYRERLERLKVVQRSIAQRAMEVDYILLDQESDLSRVAVGRRHQPRTGDGDGSRVN